MTAINKLWNYIETNQLDWAMRCVHTNDCHVLALKPQLTTERAHLRRVLRLAARSVSSIIFEGEEWIALAQSDDMNDALQQLGASRSLRCVEFVDVRDGEQLAPLLRALERCNDLTALAIPIEAYAAPAMQRLLTNQHHSLQFVAISVNRAEHIRHLRVAASTHYATVLFVRAGDDAVQQQLACELEALDQTPNWFEIHLHANKLEPATYEHLVSACSRSGHNRVGLRFAEPCHGSLENINHDGYILAHENEIDLSKFNAVLFRNDHLANDVAAADEAKTVGKAVARTVRPATAAVKSVAAETPTTPKHRHVRGFVATHCQQRPGEVAAEFALGKPAVVVSPPPEQPLVPAPLCANVSCVSRTIDYSDFHTELVCTNQQHTIRVHNKNCEAALCGVCPDCGDAIVVGERTQVRINERGERIVKPPAAAAVTVTQEPAPIAAAKQPAPPRKSNAALRRERRAQQKAAAAAAVAMVVATEEAEPHKTVQQHHISPQLPLIIDDSERVRRLAMGQFEGTRVQKATLKPLFVNVATKKTKKNTRSVVPTPMHEAEQLDNRELSTISASLDRTATSDDDDDNADKQEKDHAALIAQAPEPSAAAPTVGVSTTEATALSMVTRADVALNDNSFIVGLLQQQLELMVRTSEKAALQSTLEAIKMLVVAHEQELQVVMRD